MVQTLEQMEAAFLERLPVGKRLRGIPAQERLQGISPEELLKAMGAEDKKRLRKILEEEISGGCGMKRALVMHLSGTGFNSGANFTAFRSRGPARYPSDACRPSLH
jgi:hypothetical protein